MKIECNHPHTNAKILLSIGFTYEKDELGHPRKTICKIFKIDPFGFDLKSNTAKADELISNGLSECHPNDQLRKSEGRKIALTRALKNGHIDVEMRTSIWKQYLAKVKV